MDITVNNRKLSSNKFINGETVNYIISMFFSFFVLIAVKQILKTFIGLNAGLSSVIGFIATEISMYFAARFFVYKNNGLNNNILQAVFSVLGAGIHLGIYQLNHLIFTKKLEMPECTAWFISFFLIFLINYAYTRILVFDCYDKPEDKKNGRIYRLFFRNRFVILSMCVTLASIGFVFITFKAFPFGDTTVLRMDLYHQYGPLFVELFDRITNFESFIYSWTSGGGSSFLGNFFNYLSSPLNIFILLFDRNEMPYAITFLVALKCVLAAGTFSFYIKKSLNRHSYASAVFGVLYAFSAYMLAYFWNIMWLDGMFILPLISLGIENIINKGKCKLYIISLIYILLANYYIGFMVCIFSVIYFIAYYLLICDKKTVVDENFVASSKFSFKNIYNNLFVNSGVKFVASSLVSAGICAGFLIPVYFILSSCSATSGTFPDSAESYFTLFDFIQTHFAGLETTIRSSGDDVLPNIYSGVVCLILVPLFIVNKNIKLKDKAIYTSLILFFLLSFNNNIANYIWHALHFPNDLPYRFSFMYSFILLVIAFKSLMNLNGIGIKEIGFVGMFWVAFLAVSQEIPTNKITESTIYITLAFVIIWTAALLAIKKKSAGKTIIGVLIIAITFCEVIVSDTGAFNLNQRLTDYNENYDAYTETVDYIEDNDESFYRVELCDLNTRMDPCIYGYNGMSAFSSMAYENYSRLQYSLGMYGNRINSYTYNTQTPVYNMMYNIKYLIYNNQDVKPSLNLYTKHYDSEKSDVSVYKNDYYLPIAYTVNSDITLWDTSEGNPFDVQNDFFSLAADCKDVFTNAEYTNSSFDGFSGDTINRNGTFWLTKNSDFASASITLTAKTSGNMYIYFTSEEIKSIDCKTASNSIHQNTDTPYILDLGYFEAGQSTELTFECSDDKSEISLEIYAYTVDTEVLNKGYEKLKSGALDVSKHTDTKIAGTVKAENECILYSSIPYDKGWRVYVDGEKAETFEIGNSQLGINLSAGEHQIEYKYTPRGVIYAIPISLATIIGLTAFVLTSRKNKKAR